jgi:hypothetical protein
MVFFLGFSSKKLPKMVGIKKTALSIWTCKHEYTVNLDPIILINSVIDKMIDYLIMNHLIGSNLCLN